jgi:hypothetical protein
MARMSLVLGGAALALLMASAGPAEARRGHHHGGHHFHGHHYSHHFNRHYSHHFRRHYGYRPHFRGRHHGHRHVFFGLPFAYGGYYYGGYYSGGCSWLRRRALYTGSPYWWDRYYACRYGY